MKILSWNCCGKFREKFKHIVNIDADIFVIQECENPALTKCDEYKGFAKNHIWIGNNKNKGLGIFYKNGISLKKKNWDSYCLRYFLPVRINNCFDLLCVWACERYIEEYYVYQSIHKKKFTKDMVIIGDFNSNSIWDNKHHDRDHSNVVKELEMLGLSSAYHFVSGCHQGKEKDMTFYLYRHTDKGYHIDYAFANKEKIEDFNILDSTEWLKVSDHNPILLTLKEI